MPHSVRNKTEQTQHDEIIRALEKQLRDKGFNVKANPGVSKDNTVTRGSESYWPDVYTYQDTNVIRIYEVETVTTVNEGSVDQWKQYCVGVDFYLVIPRETVGTGKELVSRYGINVKDYITF